MVKYAMTKPLIIEGSPPLDRSTLDRMAEEFDARSGQGPFSLDARVYLTMDGGFMDLITVEENGVSRVIAPNQLDFDPEG